MEDKLKTTDVVISNLSARSGLLVQRPRQALSMEQKYKIVNDHLQYGLTNRDLAEKYNLPRTTVSNIILRDRAKILSTIESGPVTAHKLRRIRTAASGHYTALEKYLEAYYEEQLAKDPNFKLRGGIHLLAIALDGCRKLVDQGLTEYETGVSLEWVDRWKARFEYGYPRNTSPHWALSSLATPLELPYRKPKMKRASSTASGRDPYNEVERERKSNEEQVGRKKEHPIHSYFQLISNSKAFCKFRYPDGRMCGHTVSSPQATNLLKHFQAYHKAEREKVLEEWARRRFPNFGSADLSVASVSSFADNGGFDQAGASAAADIEVDPFKWMVKQETADVRHDSPRGSDGPASTTHSATPDAFLHTNNNSTCNGSRDFDLSGVDMLKLIQLTREIQLSFQTSAEGSFCLVPMQSKNNSQTQRVLIVSDQGDKVHVKVDTKAESGGVLYEDWWYKGGISQFLLALRGLCHVYLF